MIQLKSVDRVYPLKGGPFYALRGITLDIGEGDFVSIILVLLYPLTEAKMAQISTDLKARRATAEIEGAL